MSPIPIERFLRDIDEKWTARGPKITFRVIGSTALMLQTDYMRGTKDSDVLGMDPIIGSVSVDLLALAGKGTTIYQRHQVYLDVVSTGVLFLPILLSGDPWKPFPGSFDRSTSSRLTCRMWW